MKVQCSICLELLTPGDDLTSPPCGHVLHLACILQWFEAEHNCPQCRHPANERSLRKIFLAETDRNEEDPKALKNKLDSEFDSFIDVVLWIFDNIAFFTMQDLGCSDIIAQVCAVTILIFILFAFKTNNDDPRIVLIFKQFGLFSFLQVILNYLFISQKGVRIFMIIIDKNRN